MAVRYLILKHVSLGYGMLLKREPNDIGRVFFADDRTTKNIVLSHPLLSVADNISLSKFVSLGLFEGLFDATTKQKANDYLDGAIKNMHLSENECYGTIMGQKEYSFRISIDTNSFVTLSCSCPVNEPCKHLYAAFLTIKKLIDPKGDKVTPIINSSEKTFKDLLERYLYLRGGDNIPLVSKISYQIKSLESAITFITELLAYYQRGQYKARVINDILSPLFFNEHNVENFKKIMETADENIKTMLTEAGNTYQVLRDELEKRRGVTRKANLYNILLAPNCDSLIELLKHAEENFSEERLASQVMMEYIKYQDLTIEEIAALKDCYLFQMNHRYYMQDLFSSPAKNRLSIYLLLFDELPLDDNKIKQIPLEYFLKVAPYSNDKSRYIQIVYANMDSLKEEDYPLVAELLIGVALQHDYIDERTIRLAIELSKKIPSCSFISELVDQNIRRPKKSRVR
ncbi:MAG: SWIM zinc finger family protein [Bacilli bacterium]|nr:SWIM zinc finger family protein [Bacilli bacterium]